MHTLSQPGILNLVQTDETYVLSELSARAKDAKKSDFQNLGISAMHIACMFGQVDLGAVDIPF